MFHLFVFTPGDGSVAWTNGKWCVGAEVADEGGQVTEYYAENDAQRSV
jgi:hypothetical protein